MTHDQGAIRNVHGNGEFLLDQQNRDPFGFEAVQKLADQLDNFGGQAFGGFVDDDEVGVAHQGAAQREHLLLTTREHTGFVVFTLFEAGEHGKHVVKRPTAVLPIAFLAQLQVLTDRELGENFAVLWHIAQPQVGDFIGFFALNGLALPINTARALHQAHDGLGGGGTARAVAPQQGHDLALPHFEIDTMQHMAFAVIGV